MDGPKVPAATLRSSKILLMTVTTFSSLCVVCNHNGLFTQIHFLTSYLTCVCICIYIILTAQEEYRDKRRFLYGESMGGAVALLIHKNDPSFWHGAVLVAPMCKVFGIQDDLI